MFVPQSRWWRRRYYAEDGHLRPIAGSKVEPFDPFAVSPPPYLELAALNTEDERAIEGFTARFGLLGLLQEAMHNDLGAARAAAAAQGLAGQSLEWDGLVPADSMRYLPGLCGKGLARISEVIHSDALWDYLAEPVEEFQRAADEFRSAVNLAARMADGQMSTEDANELMELFARHLRWVQPEIGYSAAPDGNTVAGWARTWPFPSLLSACYHQLREELVGQQDVRLCKNERCRKPFQARSRKHLYCCDACGNAQEQRERRRGRKGETEDQAEQRRRAWKERRQEQNAAERI